MSRFRVQGSQELKFDNEQHVFSCHGEHIKHLGSKAKYANTATPQRITFDDLIVLGDVEVPAVMRGGELERITKQTEGRG